ncbi:adenine phosphoribosyltransferase [Lacisediminihabitans changchengi]|uniref:Adenine phosphoribosyltransferase n=1 Tax=Lacisediminihabitans changchengi TaxID=2787634 RepID=A0A934SKI5_9MICO|nr:adenine phosphoribosyltransferase [Lacisediminihabitans changchengi]MBK4347263.1 adenine phosphoribosyltransferase [Lacisediminihabitans changchengi]
MSLDAAREALERLSRVIPDFPSPGISFRDLTPVFADGPALRAVTDALLEPFAGRYDVIAGVEARGFVLAASAAYASGRGVVMIRKPGKLPRAVLSEDYDLEYGSATLQVHDDELPKGTRVLLIDDVLATGGTLAASCSLIERAGWTVAGIGVVLELSALAGANKLPGRDIQSLQVV